MRRLLNTRFIQTVEATLITLFFIQALRFLIGAFYSRIASASLAISLPEAVQNQLATTPGFVLPEVVTQEITFLLYILLLPLLTLISGQLRLYRLFLILAAVITAGGRTLMVADTNITSATASALAVGGGLFYIALIARHRHAVFPYMFMLALAADQLFRAAGDTLDPSWSAEYFPVQLGLLAGGVVLSLINFGEESRSQEPERGLLTFWGGLGFGAILYLQIALLSMPNAVAGRARLDYTALVPILITVTLLPLLGIVRAFARQLIGMFDVSVRGWVWLLLTALMLVLGTRFSGVIAGVGFVVAQFTVSMIWFWLVRTQAERERNASGLWLFLGTIVFALFLMFDIFTYEYAYVRGFATNNPTVDDILNNTIVPLLRGFRGLGYAVILLAAFIAALPIVQTQKRIPWRGGDTRLQNLLRAVIVIGAAVGGAFLAQPPLVNRVAGVESIRVGTYNIHGGYSEYYALNLEEIAQTIAQSGANVVMLQEIEAGRLTSFGVDQPLWLARRLSNLGANNIGMDVRFFPTNEGLQGLAVLSNVEIVFADGEILPSIGQQTGLQRVQVRPNSDTIVTVYNTWLGLLLDSSASTIEEQEQDQQRQLDEIIAIISRHHPNRQLGYTVVGGTFNNIPDSPLIERIDNIGFSDPFAGSPIERAATLVRTGLSARVDYIWIYPEAAEGANVMPSQASDHRLAFVSISLARQP